MRAATLVASIALLGLSMGIAVDKDRTVTKVVKLLQRMLDTSVKEGEAERETYAKFKCYCDQSEATKKSTIESNMETISLLESKIEQIQGGTGGLSSDCRDLKEKMADNKNARDEAQGLRDKEEKAFNAEEADLLQGIEQMKKALDTLAKVGADQTMSTGADNKQFMAGKTLLLLQDVHIEVSAALRAAEGMMNAEQQNHATAFLQAPFTGTYTSQSAVVMGILKSMRDTFEKNLETARVTEKNAIDAHKKFDDIKKRAYDEMSNSYDEKQIIVAGNDGDLASKRLQLAESQKQVASSEEFLKKLIPMCEKKAEAYANRKQLRTNEEAAISQAITILDSDEAFAAFGTTDATGTADGFDTDFIQLRAVRRHVTGNDRHTAQDLLAKAAAGTKSARLSKVVSLLQRGNPFSTVLDEIDKMLEVISKEAQADEDKLDWCDDERETSDKTIDTKREEIHSFNDRKNMLINLIEDPAQGLKVQIQKTEDDLKMILESQTKETKERVQDNLDYKQDIKNLVWAQSILFKAIDVLLKYYQRLERKIAAGEAFLQKREDPDTPPDTWGKNSFVGQSSGGEEAVHLLKEIRDNAVEEEKYTHYVEEKAQALYDDDMKTLKRLQKGAEKQLAGLQKDLASNEEELLSITEDLAKTTSDKEAVEDYLEKIKPGCDFITKNIVERRASRKTESAALNKAIEKIKETTPYKAAVTEATNESYGDCKDTCVKDKNHVNCKSCMADVTVPAYCAGHSDTDGCADRQ